MSFKNRSKGEESFGNLEFSDEDDVNLILLAVGIIVSIVVLCVLIWFSWQLIVGVEFVRQNIHKSSSNSIFLFQRDHNRVQKFRILCMVGLVLNVLLVISAFTQIGRFNLNGYHITILVVYLVISFLTQVYIFFVVDSLFKRFRDEEFPANSQRY